MKVKLNRKNPFPRCSKWKGLLMDEDLPAFGRSRLRAKLLLFDDVPNLREFWKRKLHQEIPDALAAVSRLSVSQYVFDGKGGERYAYEVYDPRYYCVIGLSVPNLTVEVLMHEAVHAGFAWAKRAKRSPWDACALELDEEAVCYPAGQVANDVLFALQKHGFCLNGE